MKNYFKKFSGFRKATVALGLVFSLCSVVPAQAGDYGSSGQPYFSLTSQVVSADAAGVDSSVGIRRGSVLSLPGASLDSEIGWGIAGAFGWLYDSNWHYEVELGHKTFDLTDTSVPGSVQPVTGEWNTETFFINGGYDFRTDSFITPYVGLGIGAALHELTIETLNNSSVGINSPGIEEQFTITPAFQAKLGVNLEIAEDMDVVLGYRFVSMINPDFSAIAFDRQDIHNFEMGLKFYIEDWIN